MTPRLQTLEYILFNILRNEKKLRKIGNMINLFNMTFVTTMLLRAQIK